VSGFWSALKLSIALCGAYILGPLLIEFGAATGFDEKALALRLVAAGGLLPILTLIIVFYKRRQRNNLSHPSDSAPDTSAEILDVARTSGQYEKASPWHYALIAFSLFMLLFLFLPEYWSGTLQRQYYLGAAFWIAIIIYCGVKIGRAMSNGSPRRVSR
jgi:hypothetical protein